MYAMHCTSRAKHTVTFQYESKRERETEHCSISNTGSDFVCPVAAMQPAAGMGPPRAVPGTLQSEDWKLSRGWGLNFLESS